MKNILALVVLMVVVFGCKAMTDTSGFTPAEHYEFAKSFYDDEDYLEAIAQFKSILVQYPGNEVTDDAQFYLGMSHFQRSEFILSAYEFSKLIKNIPASSFVPECQFMLGESYYELSPDAVLDQSYTAKCIEEFQAFIEFFPLDKRVAGAEKKINELNNKLAEKEYYNAIVYERMEYYMAAIKTYEYILRVHHDSEYVKDAMYNLIKLQERKNLVADLLRNIETFIESYPDDSRVKELDDLKVSFEGN
ncbi:MAG: outer membrane protein assembly factor BamD [Rhodothermaceae bacterium]